MLVLLAYLAHFTISGYDRFYHDAAGYWRLGSQFERDGHFSLLGYHEKYRGYVLPLLNRGLHELGSTAGLGDVATMRVFGSLLAATLGVVVMPRLARAFFADADIGCGRVLALNGLLFLYWRDHFQFPLSDFPALLAAATGLVVLRRGSAAGYFLAGLAFGVAANVRPAYLASAALVVGIAVLVPLRRRSWASRLAAGALVSVGLLVPSFPQMAINHHQRGTWSPSVAGTHEITVGQLYAGLFAQKYESYVGPRDRYPRAHVFYLDPFGNAVIRDEGITRISGYRQYLGIVSRHPFQIAASYGLHAFDGMDAVYPTPYVRDLGDRSTLSSLLLYAVLFVAGLRVLSRTARRRLGRIWWLGILVFVLPTFSALPGAIEPRFFLPVTLLAYALACFGPDFRASLVPRTAVRRAGLVGAFAAFLIVCLALSSATRAQSEYPVASRTPAERR